ncbi:MAG: efflux RND transporter permease subunit [Acidimicrobiales bacterium]|nr:efflux RND transporter permease subunit [Acidimicrobiales bacterium]
MDQVDQALRDANLSVPVGGITVGNTQFPVRVAAGADSLESVAATPIPVIGGDPIVLADVATVTVEEQGEGTTIWASAIALLSIRWMLRTVAQLTQAPNGLAEKTKSTLESAQYLPFCEFLPDQQATVLPAPFLVSRGQRLADLAVDRLWP